MFYHVGKNSEKPFYGGGGVGGIHPLLVRPRVKIILPSVSHALPMWGSFTNKDGFLALESLLYRAAKLICGLTRNMPTVQVLKIAKWDSLHFMYKVKLATLAYMVFYDCTPPSMWHILTRKTFPPRPSVSVDTTLQDLQNSSYPTKAEFNNCFVIPSK